MQSLIEKYERQRSKTLNLIPSENILSHGVLRALSSTMAGRYAARPETYGGSRVFHELWGRCEALARDVFSSRATSVSPISGHIASMMALNTLCRHGDRIAVVAPKMGGYKGYAEGYLPSLMGLEVSPLPYDTNSLNIDLEPALELIGREKPTLVVLGATVYLFPHPVRPIADAVHSYGGRVLYDGSHVMGLIAGGVFDNPLRKGADILVGSTHKTFFGPQGGVIVSDDESLLGKIETGFLHRFMDNIHLHRVAALGVALEEMKKHSKEYARNVVMNSRALATRLHEDGFPVAGSTVGFTASHQFLLTFQDGTSFRDRMEEEGIIVDSRVRVGTNEVTRRGMGPREMAEIAGIMCQAWKSSGGSRVRGEVRRLVGRFARVRYTLRD